jgi:DNA-binding GntR family transcriptional regulator
MAIDRSLVTYAYQAIKDKILDRDFYPGEMLIESKLSNSLKMSRTPIREALRMLEQEGLVLSVGNRKQVAVISVDELRQIFEAKRALEIMIMRKAALERTEEDVTILQFYIVKFNEMKKTYVDHLNDAPYFTEWRKINDDFHDEMYRIAKNERVKNIVDQLNQLWHSWRMGTMKMGTRFESNLEEHIAMAIAVIEQDADEAGNAMGIHIDTLYTLVSKVVNAFNGRATI